MRVFFPDFSFVLRGSVASFLYATAEQPNKSFTNENSLLESSSKAKQQLQQKQINRVNKLDFNEIPLIEKNAYIWKNKLYSAYDIQDVNILCLNTYIFPCLCCHPQTRIDYMAPVFYRLPRDIKTSTILLLCKKFMAVEAGENHSIIVTCPKGKRFL